MGYIHCCSALRRCKTFRIEPSDGFFVATLHLLNACPSCKNMVVLLSRIDFQHEYSEVRKTNVKAQKLFEKLKTRIMYELNKEFRVNLPNTSNPLRYWDKGVKKCYSNLSAIKTGLFESHNLPKKAPEIIVIKKD